MSQKLEDVIKEENKFSEAYEAIEILLDVVNEMPNLQEFFRKVYNDPKRETKLSDYQYTERTVDRVLSRDRKHPLDSVIINDFNQKTGSSLEDVKILYGSGADEYTRSHHALAIAVADRIYFRNGAYKPETEEGRSLIAHELTHVMQHKNKQEYKDASKTELEQEAELNELNEKYNPDPIIEKKIDGTEYHFRKSVWKKIVSNAVLELEQYIESEESVMSESEFLELLLKYQKFRRDDMREWDT